MTIFVHGGGDPLMMKKVMMKKEDDKVDAIEHESHQHRNNDNNKHDDAYSDWTSTTCTSSSSSSSSSSSHGHTLNATSLDTISNTSKDSSPLDLTALLLLDRLAEEEKEEEESLMIRERSMSGSSSSSSTSVSPLPSPSILPPPPKSFSTSTRRSSHTLPAALSLVPPRIITSTTSTSTSTSTSINNNNNNKHTATIASIINSYSTSSSSLTPISAAPSLASLLSPADTFGEPSPWILSSPIRKFPLPPVTSSASNNTNFKSQQEQLDDIDDIEGTSTLDREELERQRFELDRTPTLRSVKAEAERERRENNSDQRKKKKTKPRKLHNNTTPSMDRSTMQRNSAIHIGHSTSTRLPGAYGDWDNLEGTSSSSTTSTGLGAYNRASTPSSAFSSSSSSSSSSTSINSDDQNDHTIKLSSSTTTSKRSKRVIQSLFKLKGKKTKSSSPSTALKNIHSNLNMHHTHGDEYVINGNQSPNKKQFSFGSSNSSSPASSQKLRRGSQEGGEGSTTRRDSHEQFSFPSALPSSQPASPTFINTSHTRSPQNRVNITRPSSKTKRRYISPSRPGTALSMATTSETVYEDALERFSSGDEADAEEEEGNEIENENDDAAIGRSKGGGANRRKSGEIRALPSDDVRTGEGYTTRYGQGLGLAASASSSTSSVGTIRGSQDDHHVYHHPSSSTSSSFFEKGRYRLSYQRRRTPSPLLQQQRQQSSPSNSSLRSSCGSSLQSLKISTSVTDSNTSTDTRTSANGVDGNTLRMPGGCDPLVRRLSSPLSSPEDDGIANGTGSTRYSWQLQPYTRPGIAVESSIPKFNEGARTLVSLSTIDTTAQRLIDKGVEREGAEGTKEYRNKPISIASQSPCYEVSAITLPLAITATATATTDAMFHSQPDRTEPRLLSSAPTTQINTGHNSQPQSRRTTSHDSVYGSGEGRERSGSAASLALRPLMLTPEKTRRGSLKDWDFAPQQQAPSTTSEDVVGSISQSQPQRTHMRMLVRTDGLSPLLSTSPSTASSDRSNTSVLTADDRSSMHSPATTSSPVQFANSDKLYASIHEEISKSPESDQLSETTLSPTSTASSGAITTPSTASSSKAIHTLEPVAEESFIDSEEDEGNKTGTTISKSGRSSSRKDGVAVDSRPIISHSLGKSGQYQQQQLPISAPAGTSVKSYYSQIPIFSLPGPYAADFHEAAKEIAHHKHSSRKEADENFSALRIRSASVTSSVISRPTVVSTTTAYSINSAEDATVEYTRHIPLSKQKAAVGTARSPVVSRFSETGLGYERELIAFLKNEDESDANRRTVQKNYDQSKAASILGATPSSLKEGRNQKWDLNDTNNLAYDSTATTKGNGRQRTRSQPVEPSKSRMAMRGASKAHPLPLAPPGSRDDDEQKRYDYIAREYMPLSWRLQRQFKNSNPKLLATTKGNNAQMKSAPTTPAKSNHTDKENVMPHVSHIFSLGGLKKRKSSPEMGKQDLLKDPTGHVIPPLPQIKGKPISAPSDPKHICTGALNPHPNRESPFGRRPSSPVQGYISVPNSDSLFSFSDSMAPVFNGNVTKLPSESPFTRATKSIEGSSPKSQPSELFSSPAIISDSRKSSASSHTDSGPTTPKAISPAAIGFASDFWAVSFAEAQAGDDDFVAPHASLVKTSNFVMLSTNEKARRRASKASEIL